MAKKLKGFACTCGTLARPCLGCRANAAVAAAVAAERERCAKVCEARAAVADPTDVAQFYYSWGLGIAALDIRAGAEPLDTYPPVPDLAAGTPADAPFAVAPRAKLPGEGST